MTNLFLDIGTTSGSGLLARNWLMSNIGYVIAVVIVLILIVAGFWFVSKFLKDYYNSPEYIERKKKRPTSSEDIKEISRKAQLTKSEADALKDLCKTYRTPNIRYLVKDIDQFKNLLKEKYLQSKNKYSQEQKANYFLMRQKCLNKFSDDGKLSNSRVLDLGTEFTWTAEKGVHYKLILSEKTQDEMFLTVPPELLKEKLPENLEKITLVFTSKNGNPYELVSRIIRVQKGKNNSDVMIVTHSDKLNSLQRRGAERIDLNSPCKFSSVIDPDLTPKEKRYDATIIDVSATGCRLETNLPIKAQQKIYVEGNFNTLVTDNAIGEIVRTTKRRDNVFVLHIKFIKIDYEVQNRINEHACGYN